MEWLFGPRIPGLDFGMCLFALGWGYLMVTKPQLFDKGSWAGMQWLPDPVWIAFFTALTLMHALGWLLPRRRALRVAALLLSAWVWITIAGSFLRVDLTPGVFVYSIIGFGALCGAIYVSGLSRNGG
ncbi:hypothetical protein [Methylobacterium iners]|uniref:hypothetical protein n=1 Tax=Methylobacterium iners TaxID=418707 RepID=UPI001EE2765C|nr:hypothetical protein [Methylobacterium iners]